MEEQEAHHQNQNHESMRQTILTPPRATPSTINKSSEEYLTSQVGTSLAQNLVSSSSSVMPIKMRRLREI